MHKLSKALTFMGAILALTFCAVSCKTDDDDEPTMYTVTVSSSIEHGKVSVDKTSAEAGATIKLTATADEGYELDSYSVKDASANALTVTEGTFAMPASNVTVSATFKETAVTPQKTAGSISYATTTVSKTTADGVFTNELTKTGDGTVTYASSKETVATVNEDGEVTIKGAGTATITATVADSDTYTYATKTASYTLTVTAADTTQQKTAGSISYATTSVSKTTDEGAFTNTLTKTGNGTVSYTSDNTAVATVNEDGEVTIKGAGTATITATVADSDTYTYATKTASYTLTVTTAIPEGFVKVSGTTITGSETWTPTSNVFVSERSLTIPDLYVCDHEVTRGEFKALMGTDPSMANAYDKDGTLLTGDGVLNNPVNNVNWYAAIAYCNKLSIKEGLAPAYTVSGITDWENLAYSAIPTSNNSTWDAATCDFTANGYRLPTEAEWEWLARGGQNYTYAGSDTVGEVAWYTDNTNDTGSRDVKTKAANGYGLYDMSGNVYEWCWDRYDSDISNCSVTGAASGSSRVRRGGSWYSGAINSAVSYRLDFNPNARRDWLGFRVVRSSSN